MSGLTRFSVSLDKSLVDAFDHLIKSEHYPTRSKAVGDLIRRSLVRKEWQSDKEVVGAIILVYDPYRRNLINRLNAIQHAHHRLVIATQHVHLHHDACLEILAVHGKPAELAALERKLRTAKGVKHGALAVASPARSTP